MTMLLKESVNYKENRHNMRNCRQVFIKFYRKSTTSVGWYLMENSRQDPLQQIK